MPKFNINAAAQAALDTLNRVTSELISGVDEDELIQRYSGRYVVPGVTIRQHLKELQLGGCLRREGNKLFLDSRCNPVKLLSAA
jgi:hypothetical protein